MRDRVEVRPTWLDRAIGFVAPQAGLRRIRARAAAELLVRHYEGASTGRRTQGWRRPTGDPNAVMAPALARLRDAARDLVRNNGHATRALAKIQNNVVGWGIVAKPAKPNKRALDTWNAWAGTAACDSDGQNDFAGLQKLVLRTVVEAGEVLVRRRFRRPEDGLPIPMQLQILEPDFIDTLKTGIITPGGGKIINGVEFDLLGRRAAYWLFPEHPGANNFGAGGSVAGQSRRIPAESILHVYRKDRPGQVRGASWFAPTLLKFKDFDEYSDATLMKQKVAACLAVLTSDVDGSAAPLGNVTDTDGVIDSLEPGMILNVAAGRSVEVVQPPSVREHGEYSSVTLHEIAAGLGTPYEELTGDYSKVNYSSARMSRLSHWADVEDWRWSMLIPQFCAPAWAWAMEAAQIMGLVEAVAARWTAPPMQMIEPDKEGLAHMRNIRAGLTTLYEVQRERGYDPEELLAEYAAVNAKLDELGITLDSDPRKTTQQGLPTETVAPGGGEEPEEEPEDPAPDDEDEEAAAEAERAHVERMALITAAGARQPVTVRLEAGALQVDARSTTTIAKDALRVEVPVKIADGAIRTSVQLPLTIADTVHVPAGRRTVERDAEGRISAVVADGLPERVIVTRDPDTRRMTGAEGDHGQ